MKGSLGKINALFIKILIFMGLLSLVPGFLVTLTPIGIILLIGAACFLSPGVRSGIASIVSGVGNTIGGILRGVFWVFTTVFGVFGKSVLWLFGLSAKPTRFMGWLERKRLLRRNHQGVLVDGRHARLSEKSSYESLLVQGGVGRGKTSTFVLPNLLLPPASRPSFVITDTSGELYQASSGYLQKRGYQVRALNLMDPSQSETYNPMAWIYQPKDLANLAHTLVQSAKSGNRSATGDPFWDQAAEKLIRIMGQCLINQGDPQYQNLANLRHLITSFDAHTAPQGQLGKIDRFVLSATQNDPMTFGSYQAFVNGNLKTLQSILMSADVALDPLATPEMAALTSGGSLDFKELRDRPTALFILVNQTQMDLYSFLLNLFYADLFKALLQDHHAPGNPVWLFLDEFGHLKVNGFEVFATTARKYKVSYALFLQSLAQLESQYGALDARTVREALGAEIYLPGTSLDVARDLEARMGHTGKSPLMAAHDIIRMDENQALMLYSNRLPILLKTKRYYQRRDLRRRSQNTPALLPAGGTTSPAYLKLT